MSEEEQIEKITQIVMMVYAQDHYASRLKTWAEYIGMVFEEARTKNQQQQEITDAIAEHRDNVVKQAKLISPEERDFMPAAEILCLDFIGAAVDKAFKFSTYSTRRRAEHIQESIATEIKVTLSKVEPLRSTLEEFGVENGCA